MGKIKKVLALVIAMVMTMAMASAVFAVTITVNQDSTYDGEAGHNSHNFSYSQIFRASKDGTTTATGGGYKDNGKPGDVTQSSDDTATAVSYYLNTNTDSTQIGQLGSWDPDSKAWTKATGNLWFNLTPSSDGSQYFVSWDSAIAENSDTAQAAARWLANTSNYTPLATGNLVWDGDNEKWSVSGVAEGYYLLASDTGNNLIAATTDITVNEKNSYPPLDKTQADEDNTTQNDDDRSVAIGDILTYEVKVTIPLTAKAGDQILVWDKATEGLTYNNDVTVKSGSNTGNATIGETAAADVDSAWAWSKIITVVDGSQGTDVVFTFTMWKVFHHL